MLHRSPKGNKNLSHKGANSLPLSVTLTPAVKQPLILKENILAFEIKADRQAFYHEPINVNTKLLYKRVKK